MKALANLLLGCSLLAAASAADAPPFAEAVPIWDGVLRPGDTTELRVRVEVPAGGALAIEASTAGGPLESTASARRYRHVAHPAGAGIFETRIPMPGLDRRSVNVSFTLDGRPLAAREVVLSPIGPAQRVVAVAANTPLMAYDLSSATPPVLPMTSAAVLLHVDPQDLPFYPDSYGTVDLLVVDPAALGAIDARQLASLEQFVAGCGRLLVYGSAPALLSALRDVAGCGGRFVTASPAEASVEPAAAALLASAPTALPDPVELRVLLAESTTPARVLGLLLAYVVLVAILLVRRARPLLVLAVPAGVCSLALITWTGAAPDRHWAAWAELESGSETGRFVALLQSTGNGYGIVPVMMPPLPALPRPVHGQRPPALRYQDQSDGVTLEVDHRLLDRQLFAFAGAWRDPAPVEVDLHRGRPRLVNASDHAITDAVLAWRGDKYLVPALAPGEQWQPDPGASAAWRREPAESLFRQRALTAAAAVMLRVPPPGNVAGPGYLMVTR